MSTIPTRNEILQALIDAGSAHHDYQTNVLNGNPDEHWPGWYAAYVLGRLGDFVTPTQLSEWLAAAPFGDDWNSSASSYVFDQISGK